jgi:hypothetical protein
VDAEQRYNFIPFIIIFIIIVVSVGFKVPLNATEPHSFAVCSLWGTPAGCLLF